MTRGMRLVLVFGTAFAWLACLVATAVRSEVRASLVFATIVWTFNFFYALHLYRKYGRKA